MDAAFHFSQGTFAESGTQLAFPNGKHAPSHAEQFGFVPLVPSSVVLDFLLPEPGMAFGDVAVFLVSMPETAMYENDQTIFG